MNYKNVIQKTRLLKQLFVAICLLVVTTGLMAQTSIAVAPDKMNVLYIGVDNPVSIAAYGVTDEKVIVSVEGGGGSVSKINSGNYIVRVAEQTDNCIIQVAADGKTLGSSKFRVRRLPAPSATVGGFKSGENVPADIFSRQAGLGLYLMDFPFDVKYEVVDYTVTIEGDKGDVKEFYVKGAAFSPEAKQTIHQYLKPGRVITIDKITAKDSGGRVLKVPALVYFIK